MPDQRELPPRRILLIRPSALGDVCRTVPVLVSLRRAWPDAEIDWLVQDDFAQAIMHHPDLTRVIPFKRRELGNSIARGSFGPLAQFVAQLKRAKYDLVFDLQGLARSGFFARATLAPKRIGYADARELGWLALTHKVPVSATMHTVDRMLALLSPVGVEPVRDMRLYVSEEDRLHTLADIDLPSGGYIVIAPGSRWPGKCWPADRFAEVALRVLHHGYKVVLVGSRSEREHAGRLLDLSDNNKKVIDRMGATTIGQLMAIISLSRMVIANDSAALHMAVGFDKPIIALYGPTNIDLVGPYKRNADVIQHLGKGDVLDHKREASGKILMNRITAEEVCLRLDTAMLDD